jgi:hypothetical protein
MSCPRCEGFIVKEFLVDVRRGSLSGHPGWRCINCGAIGDISTQTNRKRLFLVEEPPPVIASGCSSSDHDS